MPSPPWLVEPSRLTRRRAGPGSSSQTMTWWSWTSPPAWSCTRAQGTTRGRWCSSCCRSSQTSRQPALRERGQGSCTASTRGPQGCWSWPGRRLRREALVAQLAARAVDRRYLAVVHGELQGDDGVIEAPLGRSRSQRTKMAVVEGGRHARTRYSVLARATSPLRRASCPASWTAAAPTRSGCTWPRSGTPLLLTSAIRRPTNWLPPGRPCRSCAGLGCTPPSSVLPTLSRGCP